METNNIIPINASDAITDRIIVSVAGEDEIIEYVRFGLTFDSPETDVLNGIRSHIQERFNVDIRSARGDWLYKTRKATNSRNIYVIPNSTAGMQTEATRSTSSQEHSLAYLDNKERLAAYEAIVDGCKHLWSKNKLQEEKMADILTKFGPLIDSDPIFLARLTSYAFKKLESKDLKVVLTFLSCLSDADGTPFLAGSELKKPNLRVIGQAAFNELDPKLAVRVLTLANSKRAVGRFGKATHFTRPLKTAAEKYVRFREANPKSLEGIYKAGLANTFKSIYRIARVAPSPEACRVLRWKQKPGFPGAGVDRAAPTAFDFTGLTDVQIAEKIQRERLKPQPVLGALKDKISPVIAAAILEQCTGDQAVVLTSLFEEQGLLKNKEVKAVYEQKLSTAKNALDRVDRIQSDLDVATKELMEKARAGVRKEQVGDIGKIFLHIDISGSMTAAIDLAKEKGCIIAECVKNPEQNFHWGVFNTGGGILATPEQFTKAGFMARLYGVRPGGGTDCLVMFEHARKLGCDTDVYLTDGQDGGNTFAKLQQLQRRGIAMPKNVVIVKCGDYNQALENGFKQAGVPVSTIDQRQLSESALVTQAIKTAIVGASAVIDEIMDAPLLALPKWWHSVK